MKAMQSTSPTASALPPRRLHRCAMMAIALCLASLLPLSAAETSPDPKTLPAPKRIVVPKLRGPIKVDGHLDEAVWAKAAVLTPFFQNDGSGRERENTVVRLWYDATALYLGWTCQDS